MRSFPVLALALLLSACDSATAPAAQDQPQEEPRECAPEDPSAVIDVNGTYEFSGERSPYFMRGTITFEQTGNVVRLVDMVYFNSLDRELEGEATLEGNRLDMTLVPTNGDTDYTAEVLFIFSLTGNTFCVAFEDTNLDEGPLGSYKGVRR